jgi:hypothetical protein
MPGGQLKQHAEGEQMRLIPLSKLAHPAHQVLLGTLVMKKEKKQHVGQLWRP